jgi:hypothetical protein
MTSKIVERKFMLKVRTTENPRNNLSSVAFSEQALHKTFPNKWMAKKAPEQGLEPWTVRLKA